MGCIRECSAAKTFFRKSTQQKTLRIAGGCAKQIWQSRGWQRVKGEGPQFSSAPGSIAKHPKPSQPATRSAPTAIPPLEKAAQERDGDAGILAATVLAKIDPPNPHGLPTIINSLQDLNPTRRVLVIRCLGFVGAAAKDAVPVLIKALKDGNQDVHDSATNALKQIDAQAAAKAGVQ
jgi:HEAT repeats